MLSSWLSEQTALVVVDGMQSEPMQLNNSVYQGRVLGPPLWNCFFADAQQAVAKHHYKDNAFADDLNCFKAFDANVSDAEVLSNAVACGLSLHERGAAKQVRFDAGEENFHIIHHKNAHGDDFDRNTGCKVRC